MLLEKFGQHCAHKLIAAYSMAVTRSRRLPAAYSRSFLAGAHPPPFLHLVALSAFVVHGCATCSVNAATSGRVNTTRGNDGSPITVHGSVFGCLVHSDSGGAIYVDVSYTLNVAEIWCAISECDFLYCSSAKDGGACFLYGHSGYAIDGMCGVGCFCEGSGGFWYHAIKGDTNSNRTSLRISVADCESCVEGTILIYSWQAPLFRSVNLTDCRSSSGAAIATVKNGGAPSPDYQYLSVANCSGDTIIAIRYDFGVDCGNFYWNQPTRVVVWRTPDARVIALKKCYFYDNGGVGDIHSG
jgi:hypothetical protein